MQIIIAGAGNFGREVQGWMLWKGRPPAGFIDDEEQNVLGTIEDYHPKEYDEILLAIASPKGREIVAEKLIVRGVRFHSLRLEDKSPSAVIGGGTIWCPRSLASAGAKVGNFVIVNAHSTVGHDVEIGDFCTLSSHVDLCGHVTLGQRVFVGSHAVLMPGVRVGDDAIIGAGSVVTRDVPAGATIYCEPGKII